MKTSLGLTAALAVLLLTAACGSDGGHVSDPGAAPVDAMPTSIPAAGGLVATRDLATVMDTGRPELCLGAVAESWPPQCSGIPLRGWDWSAQQGIFEKSGKTRWGGFAVTGRFDGSTFEVTSAIPAALYDTVAPEPSSEPDPGSLSDAELESAQRELELLPGLLTIVPMSGALDVSVVHDDGTLQDWADAAYGAGNVRILSALVPIER